MTTTAYTRENQETCAAHVPVNVRKRRASPGRGTGESRDSCEIFGVACGFFRNVRKAMLPLAAE